MLFTSYDFLLFLLIVFLAYYLLPKKTQWIVLLIASYVFYLFSGWENLLYILFTTITTYFTVNQIQKNWIKEEQWLKENKNKVERAERKEFKARSKKIRGRWLLLCILLNIGLLAVVKYTDFVISNVNGLLNICGSDKSISFLDIALPMGISFYIFKSVGYAIDVYRGKYSAEKNIFKLALFVSFFPELIQGPISRFDYLSQSLYQEHAFDKRSFSFGMQRVLWGFFKKLVIADRMLVAVQTLIGDAETYSGAWAFCGMIFYALELYADFTGGIDITIGISEALGISVEENFIRPYFSKNIKEYWNRWHITMGSWFTDYIFYPISVSQPMLKWSKKARKTFGEKVGKRVTVYVSCLVVWFATGIWHGASWNFIVWGLANGIVILITQELEPFYRWFHSKVSVQGTLGWKVFQIIRTNLLMCSLRMFDCYRDVPLTFKMWGSLFTVHNWQEVFSSKILELGLNVDDYIILIIGVIILFSVSMVQRNGSVRVKIAVLPYVLQVVMWFGLFVIIILWGMYGIGYDASQFIYNQF